jgi:hypothetical protein
LIAPLQHIGKHRPALGATPLTQEVPALDAQTPVIAVCIALAQVICPALGSDLIPAVLLEQLDAESHAGQLLVGQCRTTERSNGWQVRHATARAARLDASAMYCPGLSLLKPQPTTFSPGST